MRVCGPILTRYTILDNQRTTESRNNEIMKLNSLHTCHGVRVRELRLQSVL